MKLGPLLVALACSACTAARVVGPPIPIVPHQRGATVVVVEPFFEQSGWKTVTHAETAMAYPGGFADPMSPMWGVGGMMGPQPMTVYRDVAEKPAPARPEALAQEQQLVIREIQRLRPEWQVLSTSALQTITGPVDLIRVIVGDTDTIDSDRTVKNFACGLGLGIPALFMKIHEGQRVNGVIIRYPAEAENLKPHLLRYPTQPDFAVDTRGLTPTQQPFGLEVDYEEGMMAPEGPRDNAVVQSFAQRLAVAIIATVEGMK